MDEKHSISALVRKLENEYISGTTLISKYVNFSMHNTLERIDAYLNSKHISGETDSLGREKPFFNIVTAAVNIWYRATDIDRKHIRFVAQTQSSVVLAFVANVLLQKWMDDNRFGQFLNNWGRALSRYGGAVIKFIKNSKGLSIAVKSWNRMIVDPIDFAPNPKIEIIELTEGELRKRIKTNGYDKDVVEALVKAHKARETVGRQKKDNRSFYIKLYEITGLLAKSFLIKEKEKITDDDKNTFVEQMHVVSFVQKKGDGRKKAEFDDFSLVSGEVAKDPYMMTSLIKEDGRTLPIGATEYLFDATWMVNHSIKNMKDTLDLASKLIFQTADEKFMGRNVLAEIETGDIFTHKPNMPLTRIANDKPNIEALQGFGQMWQNLGQELTATPDSLRGITPVSGTPFSTTALLSAQSNSLFEIMVENKGLHIEDMMREHIIPHLKSKLKNTDEIVAILDASGIEEIDAIYIPKEAVNRHNKQGIKNVLNEETPEPFDRELAENGVRQSLASLGNKRFFKPDEIGKKTWADIMSDFEWTNIKVEVTNENVDKLGVLQVLSSVFQSIVGNPGILQDPNAKMLFGAILTETGKISPMQLSTGALPAPPAQVGEGAEKLNLPVSEIQK